MTDKTKKLEVSQDELDLIANALETQTKILSMQASAGGQGALARLNAVKRVLATVTTQREQTRRRPTGASGLGNLLRMMGQTT
jgi:ribosomal protein L29